MVQLQDRYKTKINSQVYSAKLEFERAQTQMKLDNDRQFQAKRAEIKARVEAEHLKQENQIRLECYQAIKDMTTVEQEKFKIDKETRA